MFLTKNRFDIIFNLAAQAGVRYSYENPKSYTDSNIIGFINLIEMAKKNKIKKSAVDFSNTLKDKIRFCIYNITSYLSKIKDKEIHNINIQKYLDTWKTNHGKSSMTISTQRGCPYTCKWCSTAVYGQSYRRRPAKLVVEEMRILQKQYNPDSIWFVDDVFTVSHKWMEEFCNEITFPLITTSFSPVFNIFGGKFSDEPLFFALDFSCRKRSLFLSTGVILLTF